MQNYYGAAIRHNIDQSYAIKAMGVILWLGQDILNYQSDISLPRYMRL